jgi:hypothetical protein
MDQPALTSPAAPPLEYAPKPPVHRRRNFRRAVWIVALVTVALIAWRWGPPYTRHASYVYWQSRCMSFTAPADHVAYEEDTERAAALATRANYHTMPLRPPPPATQPLMEPVGFVPPPLARFRAASRVAAFVGRLTSADGQERLVAVELHLVLISSNGDRRLQLIPYRATPASLLRPVVTRETSLRMVREIVYFNLARIYRLRLFWGQRDPQHPDRFTIRYIINEQPGVIEGRLDKEGNVKFTVPQGPLATRMKW